MNVFIEIIIYFSKILNYLLTNKISILKRLNNIYLIYFN